MSHHESTMAPKTNKNTPHVRLPSYQEAAADPPPHFHFVYPTEQDTVAAAFIYLGRHYCTTCGRFHPFRAKADPEVKDLPPDYREASREGALLTVAGLVSNNTAAEEEDEFQTYIKDALFCLDEMTHEAYLLVSSDCCPAHTATKNKIFAHIDRLNALAHRRITAHGAGTFMVDDARETTIMCIHAIRQTVVEDCPDAEMEAVVARDVDFASHFLKTLPPAPYPEFDGADE